jgi:hypothetical protein
LTFEVTSVDFQRECRGNLRVKGRAVSAILDPTTEVVICYIDYEGGDEGLDRRYPELVREILELRIEEVADSRGRERELRKLLSEESTSKSTDPEEEQPIVELEIMTIHGSKGLEANMVILDQMKEKKFPLFVVPDPVLKLVSPEAEPFKHAECRRLFYVILTRARNRVYIMTLANPSPFVEEIRGPKPPGGWGKPADAEVCPSCNVGYLRLVNQGRSWECSEYKVDDGCRYMRWV